VGVSFEKPTNIYGAFNDGTVALKFLRRSPPEVGKPTRGGQASPKVFIAPVIGCALVKSKNVTVIVISILPKCLRKSGRLSPVGGGCLAGA